MITVSGIGSGLDVEGLVTQLVAAEQQPASTRLDRREGGLRAKISALGALKSALSEFQGSVGSLSNASTFNAYKAISSDPDTLETSAQDNALAGEYGFEVLQRAQAQRLASDAFQETSDEIGQGNLTIQRGHYDKVAGLFVPSLNQPPVTIQIDASNGSLLGVRDAINEADIGVTANILNDGSGYRLVLGSDKTGTENSFRFQVSDADGNDTDALGLSRLAFDPGATQGSGRNLTETVAAQDAELLVDGLSVKRSGNEIEDLIDGVGINLLQKTGPGETVGVTVGRNLQVARAAVEQFVAGYNTLRNTMDELSSVNLEDGTRGPLTGDSTVRAVGTSMRRVLNTTLSGDFGSLTSLAALGVTTQRDGLLAVDSATLDQALKSDPNGVARLFARMVEASDSLISVSTSDDALATGEYDVLVDQPATRGIFQGNAITNLKVNSNSDELSLSIDGVTSGLILLTQQTYASGSDLAGELESKINADTVLQAAGVSVSVQYDTPSNSLSIESRSYGSNSSVEILTVDTRTRQRIGLDVGAGQVGQDVAGTIGGLPATGIGQLLTGSGVLAGLELTVTGSLAGTRGSISISEGLSYRLQDVIEGILDSDSPLSARLDSLDKTIERVGEDRGRLDLRMESLESRLRAQFGALDQLVGELTASGNFLSQQLSSLPGFVRESSK